MNLKSTISILLVISNFLAAFLFPFQLNAQNVVISSKARFPKERVEDIVENLRKGEKVELKDSIFASGEDIIENQYTVFFRRGSNDRVAKVLSKVDGYVVGGEYGEVIAVPITIDVGQDVDDILNELDGNSDVLAITQVVKRSISAVSLPNDPLYPPVGNFSSSYQWYLNQSASGSYGIDVLRAWQHMDSAGKNWQGDDSITVAVLDTGLAYETTTKYPYTGGSWGFGASTDTPAKLKVNSGEIASNGVDDDANGGIEDTLSSPFNTTYCLDENANGQCDSPAERTKGYVDDVNGLNVVDFYNYWAPLNVTSAPNCTNEPYTAYKCVPQRVCESSGESGSNHFGCDISEMGHPNDMMGHGTAVSSIIAGTVNNSIAGTGIAPNVSILPVNVFKFAYNSSASTWGVTGSSEHIARAVDYAVDSGAKIINMSFGGTLPDPYEQLAMERAYEQSGVLLVAASGNSGGSSVQYPAGYSGVIAVGASSKNGTRVSYSNYGSALELVAPVSTGVPVQSYTCYFSQNCLTTNPRPNSPSQFTLFSNGSTSGTSFAAPQVAGVAALIWTMYPTWTNEQVRQVLKLSATQTVSEKFTSSTGYGVLNAYNAVRAVDDRGSELTTIGRVYQTVRGSNNLLYDRYSDDYGSTWGVWKLNSVNVVDQPTLVYNSTAGRMVQARRDSRNGFHVRNSTNFGDTWSAWLRLGSSLSPVTLISADDRIILSIRGTNNGIYTRFSSNGGQNWSAWNRSGSTPGYVSMIYDSNTNRIVQSVKGMDNRIYTRYSANKGDSWSKWVGSGSTPNNITLLQASTRIMMFVRGNDNAIYSRYSTNGGQTWGAWSKNSSTYGDVTVVYTGTRLVQVARASDSGVLIRNSTNLGSTWSSWIKSGRSNHTASLTFTNSYNRVILSVVGMEGGIWNRYSDDRGKTWGPWVQRGTSPSPSDMIFVETESW